MLRFFAGMLGLSLATTLSGRASSGQAEDPAAAVARAIPLGGAADYAARSLAASGKARLERVDVIDRCRLTVTMLFPRTDGKGMSPAEISLGDVTRVVASGPIVVIAQDGLAMSLPIWMRIADATARERLVAAVRTGADVCDPRKTGGPLMRQLGRASMGATIESPVGGRTDRKRTIGPFYSLQHLAISPCSVTFWRGAPTQQNEGDVAGTLTIDFAKAVRMRRSGVRFDFTGPGIWYRHGQSIIFPTMADADIAARAFAELKQACTRR